VAQARANGLALKPVYTAPTESAALERFLEFAEAWGGKSGHCQRKRWITGGKPP
jgi:hypothetical protein